MALHFERSEFDARLARLLAKMQEEKLDAMLLFAQESMYWLTGYDTFGYCFFQTLVVKSDGTMVLLTRSADLRQAQLTSVISDIRIWVDRVNADPTVDLKELLVELDLLGARIGVEYDTHGMTGRVARLLDSQIATFGQIVDASYLVGRLRLVKSPTEIAYVEHAAALADDALDTALALIKPNADEADILAAMQGTIFSGGGDYPANEFIVGSGPEALLCRYKAGRRKLDANDQLTLEWAGTYAHYHAAMMRTVVIGDPTHRHRELFSACLETIQAIETVLKPGHTFGDVFDMHAKIMDERGLARHRLNACGYSLGARFSPSWMEHEMFVAGNPQEIEESMSLFVHMIIMDSDTGTAMTLGQTYLTTSQAPRALSRHQLEFLNR
ncbi:Xaa-Pro peptidase family protein [Agrobacterium sp. SHOUNA12C]|uniref:Xaa-Pro dipeptidase protein n=2 Tax=Rhizobium rhizogenes TaxID=359 RepID=B9J786_RHIR8|nr:M24 family metallopeptidase [Rhizobium rhizogenes]ACM27193.1 Xaa-Pro dipeptidase protein [Rhizobium rhizogenes K84]KAA6490196.1 aminopeptidase P family protein [Agrobacterium sp. ICMP 7243]MCJ9719667.1 Xaa-Pro peptidase family protein [Agrobacterium sp. BETTINA12B]MCJ9755398.1 Xaa-Pro peptidase family protein [Agrobacterium sp. SHOUNA12C]OCJ05551.1 Xaa-Pro dipeptidase [Agrobacterium sp. 13-626]OCJ14717.1 Xaa-Pro dipeptidase [Agrobacterium sp. B133/95]OCJ26236.1 Xaa-Pro dipeptidase [Agroba